MTQVIKSNVYAFLDLGMILYILTPYVAMNFYVIFDQLSETLNVSTYFGESVLI